MKKVNLDQAADRMQQLMPLLMRGVLRHEKTDMTRGILSIPHFWGLEFIQRHEPCPVHGLSDALDLRFSTISEMVNRLVAMGLVARRRDAQDRRVVLLSLTSRGSRLVRDTLGEKRESYRRLLKPLSAEERAGLLEIVGKIVGLGPGEPPS